MKHLSRILLLTALVACQREVPLFEEGEIRPGEAVVFTTLMPGKTDTKATDEETAFNTRMGQYKAVADAYSFSVEMYEEGIDYALGSATYVPASTVAEETTTYPTDGTLKPAGETVLYWPGNAKKYGFKATAGTETLESDQSDAVKLLAQDQLLGYGFEPLWNTVDNKQADNENALNYRSSKEWYAANKQTRGMAPGSMDEASWYKKIPLYFQHRRSLITIRLKAGEGVDRDALKTLANISTKIYSYSGGTTEITPYGKETTIDYVAADYGGAATGVATSEYTAIVQPYDYRTNATTDVIAEIALSGQRFTFYADNDSQKNDPAHMENYNLTAGKHLVITATLGRESRKILITAYIEDWTETVTSTIVDDYGQAGDPIQINNRQELYTFLKDNTKNKPGNVAIIVPNSLNLEKSGDADAAWDDTDIKLNCTLNLAGATLYTNHRIFNTVGSSGTLVNGTVCIGNGSVTAAVTSSNLGTLERIVVSPKDNNGNDSNGKATVAGLAETNSGSIIGCTSTLPVEGVSDFVGGIAGRSVYSDENTMPVIDGCTVNARVTGTGTTKGGGIVGEAAGRVTNNAFVYGITLLQDATNFKNIIQAKAVGDKELRAYGNAWPTKAENSVGEETSNPNTNLTPAEERYDATIDNQMELETLLTSAYNKSTTNYRISHDFAVTGWDKGKKHDDLTSNGEGNVFFKLDGNGKTITTDGMLFSNIRNEIHDLTVRLGNNLVATPATEGDPDAIAALGYSVSGSEDNKPTGILRNIQVKAGTYCMQASTVGGLVVWAYDGALIENCQCKAKLQVWVQEVGDQTKIYSGGIVAAAAKATLTRCIFHNSDNTLYRNSASEYTNLNGDAETTPTTGIYYGGILGGTAPKGTSPIEYPSVLMTDCTSWFTAGTSLQLGSLVGYSQYSDASSVLQNGMADDCQGNWWPDGSNAIGSRKDGKTIEQTIGKRNAVTPNRDTTYDN